MKHSARSRSALAPPLKSAEPLATWGTGNKGATPNTHRGRDSAFPPAGHYFFGLWALASFAYGAAETRGPQLRAGKDSATNSCGQDAKAGLWTSWRSWRLGGIAVRRTGENRMALDATTALFVVRSSFSRPTPRDCGSGIARLGPSRCATSKRARLSAGLPGDQTCDESATYFFFHFAHSLSVMNRRNGGTFNAFAILTSVPDRKPC